MPATTLIQPEGKAPETFKPGRTCVHKGCATTLSVYNGQRKCWLHGKPQRTQLWEHRDAWEQLADFIAEGPDA